MLVSAWERGNTSLWVAVPAGAATVETSMEVHVIQIPHGFCCGGGFLTMLTTEAQNMLNTYSNH